MTNWKSTCTIIWQLQYFVFFVCVWPTV